MSSPLTRALSAAGLVGALLAGSATTASAATGRPAGTHRHATVTAVRLAPFEARLLTLVNAERARHHLAPLLAAPGATDVARRWSVRLSGDGALSHNPALVREMTGAGSRRWHFLAENVGVAPADDPDGLFAAFMASPHHRDNILSRQARFVGIGVVSVLDADGSARAWNTMDFSDSYDDHYGKGRTHPVPGVVGPGQALAALTR